MIKQTLLLTVLAAAAAAQAQAPAPNFVDRARVTNAEPQYENVQVPRQECSSQWVTEQRPVAGGGNYGGAVIGGVAGGIIGNQVGRGHGREAATAVGAVVGAIAGDRIANNGAAPAPQVVDQREVRSCRTVYDMQQRATGWRVTYEYRGQQYTTVLRDNPGNTLPVRVSVVPLEQPEYHR